MRRIFTTQQFYDDAHTRADLRQLVRDHEVRRLERGVYIDGGDEPTSFDRALGRMVACGVPAWGTVAGRLHGLDSMDDLVHAIPKRHQTELLDPTIVEVEGHRCTSALQAIIDVAYLVDDLVWEQALESGLHKKLFTIPDIEAHLPRIRRSRRRVGPGTTSSRPQPAAGAAAPPTTTGARSG